MRTLSSVHDKMTSFSTEAPNGQGYLPGIHEKILRALNSTFLHVTPVAAALQQVAAALQPLLLQPHFSCHHTAADAAVALAALATVVLAAVVAEAVMLHTLLL